MTTNIYHFNGNILTSIPDNAIDTSSSSLNLPGYGYSNYGEPVLQNMIWTLQHFANDTAPSNPVTGQNWYDTSVNAMKVYNGNSWISASGVVVSAVEPVSGTNESAFWYDTINQQMNVWNQNQWDTLGLSGSAINADPIANLTQPNRSDIDTIQLRDSSNILHSATRISVGGSAVAILSKDSQYTLKPAINGFNTIVSGINLNSLIVPNNIDTTIFRSTQDNLPDVNGIRSLGSKLLNFSNIYAKNSVLNNQLLINSQSNSLYNFEVTGNSLIRGDVTFGNTVNFGPGSVTEPPIIINQGNLLLSPEIGAFEFDGQNLYITTNNVGVPDRKTIVLGQTFTSGSWGFILSGTANNIIATCTPAPPSIIPNNTIITGVLANTNTSSNVTITVNTFSPVTVLLNDGVTPPPVGSLIAGHVVQFKWNGANWLAVNDLTFAGQIGTNSAYLPLSGGTMTGFPVLPGNPTSGLQAAPKQYVDSTTGNLNATLTTLSSQINSINLSNYLPLAGGTMTGFPVLPGNPTSGLQAAPKQYVDTNIPSISSSTFVPLSGSIMSGFLKLFSDPTSALNAVTKQYADKALSGLSNFGSLINVVFLSNVPNIDYGGGYLTGGYSPSVSLVKYVCIIASGGGNSTSGAASIISFVPITSYTPSYYAVAAGTYSTTSANGGPSGFGINTGNKISQWIVRAGGAGTANSYSIPGTGILFPANATSTIWGTVGMGAPGNANNFGITMILEFA